MAATESKRSIVTKATRPKNRQGTKATKPRNKLYPGELALQEKQLPHRRFVDFSLVVGKTIERFHFFTSSDYHCITVDLQDKTTLNLEIEPGFIIKAQLQQVRKGDINIG